LGFQVRGFKIFLRGLSTYIIFLLSFFFGNQFFFFFFFNVQPPMNLSIDANEGVLRNIEEEKCGAVLCKT
jgi:hypothetical protein